MQSPNEGAEGIKNSEDFRDTIKLLDYARSLASQPQSSVHVLHLKYRFHNSSRTIRSPYSTGDWRLPLIYPEFTSRTRNPVPQPFSVLHDPVVKIDYLETGVFDPLPSQAILRHIAKACQPPPRIIVVSYVCSTVTENHLAALSAWALTSSPPAYVFSPLETRLRERQPLHQALHHAVPMSMYAWPADRDASQTSLIPSIVSTAILSSQVRHEVKFLREASSNAATFTKPSEAVRFQLDQQRPADPVATLTVVTADAVEATLRSDPNATIPPPIERIPLWNLVPGVGALHGSTASSIGIRLSDFSASNLQQEFTSTGTTNEAISNRQANIASPPMDLSPLFLQPPVEALSRPSTPSKGPVPHHLKDSTAQFSPPDGASPNLLNTRTQSWPPPVNKVHGWRKGRKELMEDTLETVYLGQPSEGMGEMVLRIKGLGVGSAHEDPVLTREGWKNGGGNEKNEEDELLQGLLALAQ
ncbi:MAG: hypothetical protein TREMPRED_000465 [Tremellales sp. Tagirdzhanova-0007]|nr:MAG: hypothetical protein TREMPRED_000465 [Tremellales sp. Tagirdzhanova-0007]